MRAQRSQTNFHAGVAAEQMAARHFTDQGLELRETRWRGTAGEIDLILSRGEEILFVEVKKAASHAQALARVGARQIRRILQTAEEYLGTCPNGLLTECRFDVALVDDRGRVSVVPNASMMA